MIIPHIKRIVKEHITLKLSGFYCTGYAKITDWYFNKSFIEMEEYKVKSYDDITKGINDNGFGSQFIDGAIINIFPIYDDYIDYTDIVETIYHGNITKNDIDNIEKKLF